MTLGWTDLPTPVRSAITDRCGTVAGVGYPGSGKPAHLTATLHTPDGTVFCEGAHHTSPRYRDVQHAVLVSGQLPSCAPTLHWTVAVDGWLVVGQEHIPGQHANLSPGSADLPAVVKTVTTMARQCSLAIPPLDEHWSRLSAWRRLQHAGLAGAATDHYLEWEDRAVEAVGGNYLLHTALDSRNILVDEQVRVVGWTQARRGAAWVDRAFLALNLIAAGHRPAEAEGLVGPLPSDSTTAFTVAILGISTYLEHTDPLPHRVALTDAAQAWVNSRLASPSVPEADRHCYPHRDTGFRRANPTELVSLRAHPLSVVPETNRSDAGTPSWLGATIPPLEGGIV
ncbi:hypothetical protein Acsp05_14580 [Actinokineospora sp. NBRC 105648]|nr:hypothetical protein Acsp05_14580 [Actinokineospora sp. NBRC 105648]